MADERERRQFVQRAEDRELLVDHGVRIGRLERDVDNLSVKVDREIDELDLKFPTFDRVAKDYVPRAERHQLSLDRRARLMLTAAIAGVFVTPFLAAAAALLIR